MVHFAELAPWWTGIISPSADLQQLSALLVFESPPWSWDARGSGTKLPVTCLAVKFKDVWDYMLVTVPLCYFLGDSTQAT